MEDITVYNHRIWYVKQFEIFPNMGIGERGGGGPRAPKPQLVSPVARNS